MMLLRVYLIIFSLLILPLAVAAPVIDDVGGALADSETLVIRGSGFGVKSPVAPVKYDSFDQGAGHLGESIDETATGSRPWSMFSSCAGPGISTPLNATRYSALHPRYPGDVAAWKFFGYNSYYDCFQGTNYLQLDNPDSWHQFYLSMWLYSETNGDANMAKVRNAKIANWGNSVGGEAGYPQGRWDIYPVNNMDSGHVYVLNCDHSSDFNSWGVGANDFRLGQQTWNRFEAVFDAGDVGVANGGYAIVRDGEVLKDSGPVMIMSDASCSPVDSIYITHYFDDVDEGYDLPAPQAQYWHGEIYVDDTPARIELCNVSDWSQRPGAHCELQVPKDVWVDNQINMSVHMGSFTQADVDAGLYLFIIDANKEVSNGHPLQMAPGPRIAALSSSTLVDGQSVTLLGSGFGVKSPAEPMFWDTIDNQPAYDGLLDGDVVPVKNDGCVDCPWQDNTPSSWGMEPVYSDQDIRSIHPHYRVFGKGFFRDPPDWPVSDDLIANYWMRVNGTPGHYDGSNGNFKFNRLYVDSGGFGTNGGCTCQTSNCVCTTDTADGRTTDWGSWGGGTPYVWRHVEMIADAHEGYELGVGEFSFLIDNDIIFHFDNVLANGQLKLFWILGFDSLDDWHDYLENASMDWGEIYVDNTTAKVAIGDASSWSDVIHWEVQIPHDVWVDDSIRFAANLGSFSQADADAGLYLFVFDANGTVSPGFGPLSVELDALPSLPGDLNGDGVVSLLDLVSVRSLDELLLVGRNL